MKSNENLPDLFFEIEVNNSRIFTSRPCSLANINIHFDFKLITVNLSLVSIYSPRSISPGSPRPHQTVHRRFGRFYGNSRGKFGDDRGDRGDSGFILVFCDIFLYSRSSDLMSIHLKLSPGCFKRFKKLKTL